MNFKKRAIKTQPEVLEAIILGAQGAGKSGLIGTAPGPTLQLICSTETHGAYGASATGDNVTSICYDRDEADKTLKPEEALECLSEALNGALKAGFKTVAIDGLNELERLIRATPRFTELCKSSSGKHSVFEEPVAVKVMMNEIIGLLKVLESKGVNVIVTCDLDVRDKGYNGEILDSKPRLSTYSVVENAVQKFRDVLVVGMMSNDKGESGRCIQFLAGVSRDSKDKNGRISKTINFQPRLGGIPDGEVPKYHKADLEALLTYKKEKLK